MRIHSVAQTIGTVLLAQVATAGAIPNDADERAIEELHKSRVPIFYAACDFRADGPGDTGRAHDERLIWLFSEPEEYGILFIHDKRSGSNLLAIDCSLDERGERLECEQNVGTWAWDLYGIGDDGLLNPPNTGYSMIAPGSDFMAAIVADKSVEACRMPKTRRK